MDKNVLLEEYYKIYTGNLHQWLHDGMIEVNIALLQQLNLLKFNNDESHHSALTRYFNATESDGKLTLFNEQFVVWITPDEIEDVPITHTLIALNHDQNVHLELGFITRGIYNNSHLVLRILEKYLSEIQETEALIHHIA